MGTANLGDVQLHYIQMDDTPAQSSPPEEMVLVHGLAANLGFWYFAIAPILATTFRVTLFDLRGHGRSSMPATGYKLNHLATDLEQLLDHLQIQQAHLLGHSLGGAIATHFACQQPHRVKSLMLADTRLKLFQPEMRFTDWPHWPKYQRDLEAIGIVLDPNSPEMGYQLLCAVARAQVRDPAAFAQLQTVLPPSVLTSLSFANGSGKRSAQQFLKLIETTTAITDISQGESLTLGQLKAFHQPLLAVYGEYSQAHPTLTGLQQACPQAYTEIIPGVGHFFPTAKPEALLRTIEQFLQTQYLLSVV